MKVLNASQFVKLRKAAGLNQLEVYRDHGVSDVVLSRLENGRVDNPLPKTLRKLARAYNCEVADFYIEEKQVLPTLVDRELKKHVDAIKRLLAGSEGTVGEFFIEMTLKDNQHRAVRHTGKYNE